MNKQTATKSTKPAAKSTPAKSVAAKSEPAAKLSHEQKRRLAWVLLETAAVIAESWDDVRAEHECADIDAALVAPMFSQWLQYLPHDAWPTNFTPPTSKYVQHDVEPAAKPAAKPKPAARRKPARHATQLD